MEDHCVWTRTDLTDNFVATGFELEKFLQVSEEFVAGHFLVSGEIVTGTAVRDMAGDGLRVTLDPGVDIPGCKLRCFDSYRPPSGSRTFHHRDTGATVSLAQRRRRL